MNIAQISSRARQVLRLPDATADDLLSAREAEVFCRIYFMMSSNLGAESTAHQRGELLQIETALLALGARLDARLA